MPMPSSSPPLPRCVFRVAISGHRWNRFPAEAEPVIDRHLRRALAVIREEVHRVGSWPASGYARRAPELVFLSGLAAGADQLGARAAIATSGWELHAVLPFERAEYERDFANDSDALRHFCRLMGKADLVTVLDGPCRPGPDGLRPYDAYAPLARVLVDQCDLLIAVWDGSPARGVGGTAAVVKSARESDVPILRINPRTPKSVTLEARPDQGDEAEWIEALQQQVARLLAPPEATKSRSAGEPGPREQYFAESLPRARRGSLFDLAGALFHRRAGEAPLATRVLHTLLWMIRGRAVDDPAAAATAAWSEPWRVMPGEVRGAAFARFAEHQGWADALATHYAAAFRATYTRVFAFAWLAVLAAFVGTAAEALSQNSPGSAGAIQLHNLSLGVEAVILSVVFANVYWGRRQRLHERWLDYRALAERLRHLAVLWPLGRATTAVRLPAIALNGDPKGSWLGWYLRAVTRESGLVPGVFDRAHVAASRSLLRDGELDRQLHFHEGARDRGLAIVHPLERGAEGLFLLALLVALANLLGWPDRLLESLLSSPAIRAAVLGALGVGLPALASGIHGFLGTSDLESIAIRSGAVAPRLRELIWRLDRLDPADSTSVGEIGAEAARVMEGELGSWRAVTAARKLQAV